MCIILLLLMNKNYDTWCSTMIHKMMNNGTKTAAVVVPHSLFYKQQISKWKKNCHCINTIKINKLHIYDICMLYYCCNYYFYNYYHSPKNIKYCWMVYFERCLEFYLIFYDKIFNNYLFVSLHFTEQNSLVYDYNT